MSRGPGLWQRKLIEHIATGHPVVLTNPDHTTAQQNAIRRAANTLEARGELKIISVRIDGRPRLVAYPRDVEVPAIRLLTGLDGKTYRMPAS